jgi:2-dehydro-3-deoxyphosphogluconate aldolase / (4S)-4-hydroxy-2-oxoglutarate aldolase
MSSYRGVADSGGRGLTVLYARRMTIRDILAMAPVIPVLTITRIEHAVPLARALVRGGLRVLEVTLRTPVALDVVQAMRAAVPDAVVGVGTLTRVEELGPAERAGARFGVSPGFSADLCAAARSVSYPLLPGVMTPSELLAARAAGFTALKLFPAEQAGGIGMLRALAAPFPDVMFCPTGGVTEATASAYLALPNVPCVGGSWVAPSNLVAAGDWSAIEGLARAAAALKQ